MPSDLLHGNWKESHAAGKSKIKWDIWIWYLIFFLFWPALHNECHHLCQNNTNNNIFEFGTKEQETRQFQANVGR